MEDTRLRRKISHWLDGALPSKKVRALESELKESASARSEYLVLASIHAELCNQSKGQELLESIETSTPPLPAGFAPLPVGLTRSDDQLGSRSQPWGLYTIAASLLLGLGLWWGAEAGTDKGSRHSVVSSAAVDTPAILVSLEPLTDQCAWYVEEASRDNARSYQSGDVIRVTSGNLSLAYANGTNVVLQSPAAYQLISGTQARMIIGRLTATVPEAGKGFTVITPQANVIDLGTEFGVEVNRDGATDVVVFKGEVDLDYHNQETSAQRLRMGEAVRLDAVGTSSRLVSVNGDSFSGNSVSSPNHPNLIAEVRDNIGRDSSMLSFYEIISTGMQEDALAYVDRIAHQYNGVTTEGMPSYLLGGDYVKMFNNDKYLKTIRVEVTLNAPAKLYILLDSRRTPPVWLTEEFRYTGDDIGLDNGPFQTVAGEQHWHNKGPSGVGPGESVDDVLGVWVKEVTAPGVVQLGPMGTTTAVGANMYGIVATSLQMPR